jgi:hypothetical protein
MLTAAHSKSTTLRETRLWEPPDLGQVGLDWQLGAFAVDPPTDNSGEVGRLVQAMAGFGGGAADSSNVVSLGADTSQQQFLTAPQHA